MKNYNIAAVFREDERMYGGGGVCVCEKESLISIISSQEILDIV